MKFEDWWNEENKIEFSNEPDDYSKAKYVYAAVYNSMKNCLNCLKRRHCFLWHQANNFSKANDVNYHCRMSDKWEDEDYAEE